MDIDFGPLLKAVDLTIIAAIVAITFAVKAALTDPQTGNNPYWRWIPLVPLALGLVAGWIVTQSTDGARAILKAALLYGGAASLLWEIGRTTVFKAGAKADAALQDKKP
jgi:hypothetical protein